MTRLPQPALLPALLFFVCTWAGSAFADDWELRSETTYSTGTFGTGIRTEVLYAPLEIRRKFEWGELGLAVPYLWYRVDGTFSFLGGGLNPPLQTVTVSGSAEGLSDLLIDAKYNVLSQSGNRPEVVLRGYWKPPTADDSRGLGTGTHDWIIGAEMWSWLPGSQRCFYFGDLYYYIAGSSESRGIRDTWIYDLGIGGLVTDNLVAKISYWEQTSLASGLPSARLIELETEYKLTPKFTVLSGFSVGISDAAPDWIAMLGFEQTF